ncbi:hypothetical protein [Segniliparus rugosus]|uniref:Uncharacterized protein n=1 Tax=Segniliparus rugosus (strain ATCC BAA-974 / DSM 45345 / CCUG 50838 / CIP 108380 / JCM 13579 / CDC 945) TaxID=679197 RepID=E5XQU3_SEGRC|nr:hypothetical protein [Segniliparus rugosus]EFV13278.1 hypothetical protein HMPREF9336_01865 [Segniliparus rugosus ATCC BAA-974]
MSQDDPWTVPYADLEAVRGAENSGKRKIWPWVAVGLVFALGLAAGTVVLVWFARDSLDDLRANGKIGQRVYLRAHAYADQGSANNAESAEVKYTLVHHLANKSQPQSATFGQTVSLPWEPPAQGSVLDLEGSLVEITMTVRVPHKSNGNLAGPTCSLSLDGDLLDNKAASGYGNEVTCHWRFTQ